jgi:hypothetical protein
MNNDELQAHRKADRIWHRIMMDNPELTRGPGLSDFLEDVLPVEEKARAVVVAGVEGGGDPLLGITQLGCVLMATGELQVRLRATSQIDWANFYFISNLDENLRRRICDDLSIIDAVTESNLSVRVIDDSSLEIFSPNYDLVAHVLARYPSAKIQSSLLIEMDFPQ